MTTATTSNLTSATLSANHSEQELERQKMNCLNLLQQLEDLKAKPSGMVLPERKQESPSWGYDMGGNYDEGYADGFNACLDEVARLNQPARSALSADHSEKVRVPDGWAFYTADFSCVASGLHATGKVTLVRDQAGKAAWHKITAGIEDVESAPPLYVFGRGRTLSEAIASAAVEAAAAGVKTK